MISRLIAAFAALALATAPLAQVEAAGAPASSLANDIAVGAVVSIGVATVIAGGAMLGGSDAGLAIFAVVAAGLAVLQGVLRVATPTSEPIANGTNVARNASTRVSASNASSVTSTGGGAPR
jgi:hypothetical protein